MRNRILKTCVLACALPMGVDASQRLGRSDFEATPCKGMNRSDIAHVDFFLYFPEREQALVAAEGVDVAVFDASVRPAAEGPEQLLYLRYRSLPTRPKIEADAKALHALAQSTGGRVDGSGCASHLYRMDE